MGQLDPPVQLAQKAIQVLWEWRALLDRADPREPLERPELQVPLVQKEIPDPQE